MSEHMTAELDLRLLVANSPAMVIYAVANDVARPTQFPDPPGEASVMHLVNTLHIPGAPDPVNDADDDLRQKQIDDDRISTGLWV